MMKFLVKNLPFFVVALTVVAGIAITRFFGILVGDDHAPSDAQMISWFDDHEKTFDRIASMCEEDKLTGFIWSDSTSIVSDPVPAKERIATYRSLCQKLELPSGINSNVDNKSCITKIELPVWSFGILSDSFSKGYLYCNPLELPCSDNLDVYTAPFPLSLFARKPPELACRKIKDHWYLLYRSSH